MRLFWIVAGVMVLDQATKLIVRLNMDIGHLGRSIYWVTGSSLLTPKILEWLSG